MFTISTNYSFDDIRLVEFTDPLIDLSCPLLTLVLSDWPMFAINTYMIKIMADQLNTYFRDIFYEALSAFRTGNSCQDTLLALIEKFKRAITEHHSARAISKIQSYFKLPCIGHVLAFSMYSTVHVDSVE